MTSATSSLAKLLRDDPRYKLEAYQFVAESLTYAQEVLKLGAAPEDSLEPGGRQVRERHLTGQQLCEAIRRYAVDQYGYLAKEVLENWGVRSTGDFGEIVYNLIRIGKMKKSKSDQREHFDDVFDFNTAFREQFEIQPPE